VAAQRSAVANILGVTESVVPELFFNVDHPIINPTEEQLEATFGYEDTRKQDRFAPRSRPQLITWQRENLEQQWQTQDWATDDYSGDDRLPYIDPALVDESFLRTPLDTNPAHPLLTERQALLSTHRQGMVAATSADLAGLDALLEGELSQPIDQLQTWFDALQGEGDENTILNASDAVATLNLSPAGFSHLMTTRSTLANDAALGETEDEIEAVWNSVFDILSSAHRHRQFATWVDQEDDEGIVFGPKLFWPAIKAMPINPWLADESEQDTWLAALEHRSQPPIIDPDRIPQAWVLTLRVAKDNKSTEEEQNSTSGFAAGLNTWAIETPLDAMTFWERRRAFVDARMLALDGVSNNQADPLVAITNLLTASNTGLTPETLLELREQEAIGHDITPRLAQFMLESSAYRVLAEAHTLAEADTPIPPDMWEDAVAILVQVEKQREFAEWRDQEEAAEITLHPNRFQILTPADKVADSVRSKWLHNPHSFSRWVETLEARKDQFETLETALANAVGAAEDDILPRLRDLLISDSAAPGDSFLEKAEWLDKRLLMDMSMSGCQMTTRVSLAIESLQRLVRGVYTREHVGSLLEDFALDAVEDYEAEWPVIGTYATWKAYMEVYLFPENAMLFSQQVKESSAFTQLKNRLSKRITPVEACQSAKEYTEFFKDVSNLKTEAVCQALTRRSSTADNCEREKSDYSVLLHIFARSTTSGNVYVASTSTYSSDLVYQWKLLPKAGSVERIISATTHDTPEGKRYILLFVITKNTRHESLEFLRYDLDTLDWRKKKVLTLPDHITGNLTVCAIQKRPNKPNSSTNSFSPAAGFPTLVAIQDNNNIIYLKKLNHKATGWSNNEWFPLYGSHFQEANFLGIDFKLVSLAQRTEEEYMILIEDQHKQIYYRSLNIKKYSSWPPTTKNTDDLRWRNVSQHWIKEGYSGLFCLPLSNKIAILCNDGPWMHYRTVKKQSDSIKEIRFSPVSNELEGKSVSGSDDVLIKYIDNFNSWLESNIGVSLKDYPLTISPNFYAPIKKKDFGNPLDPIWRDREVPQAEVIYTFSGSLYELLTLSLSDFKIHIPEDVYLPDDVHDEFRYFFLKQYFLIQLLDQGVQKFSDDLSSLNSLSFLDSEFGSWKLASYYLNLLSKKPNDSIVKLVTRLSANRINVHLNYLNDAVFGGVEGGYGDSIDIRIQEREGEELSEEFKILGKWVLPPFSGDGIQPRGQSLTQTIAVTQSAATFITRWNRDGQQLQYERPPFRITPDNEGPYGIAPMRMMQDIQQRRVEIQNLYTSNGKALINAPLSVRTILKEAFNLVPIHLGQELQRSGFYEDALLWYRQVYDYLQVVGKRKIDHSLKLEQSLDLNYADAEEWLNDATNPHAIAATRKNTHTRQILLLIIRCLVDYADALFARDNVTDNAHARELYNQALKFLDLKVLKPKKSNCENILGELEVDIDGTGQLPLQQFQYVMAQIPDPERLRTTVGHLRAIDWDTTISDVDLRVDAMHAAISEGLSSVRTEAEALPVTKSLSTIVEQDKPQVYTTLEARYLSTRTQRSQARKANQQRKRVQLNVLASITDTSEGDIPWLRQARPSEEDDNELSLAALEPGTVSRLAVLDRIRQTEPLQSLISQQFSSFAINTGVSFSFCIPQNPVISALRRRAENNLTKLRTCRNIAGFLRQVDPYGAAITIGSGMVSADGSLFSGVVDAPPTPYRYAALIARAKELVSIAQQIEGGYQSALEAAEREALSVLQAEQHVELAGARVELQGLRINQANSQMELANLQKGSAELREQTYVGWINAGKNEHEKKLLEAYRDAGEAQQAANAARTVAQVAGYTAAAIKSSKIIDNNLRSPALIALHATQAAAAAAEGIANGFAINAQTRSQIASFEASFERRNDEWQLQQGLAAQDLLIGDQQIQLARDGIAITQQERAIAELEQTHAANILQFLLNKNFDEEMYRWIASVLEDVYRYFLQEAASIARLAERQLAFERQQGALKLIQSDYWNVPLDGSSQSDNTDRLGITGSARLLKDIYQLDQHAFASRQRKQSVSVTLDLAELFPFEFQQFRETGVLVFETPQSLIDQQFPGNYLCLIQQVTVSVVALILPTYGIRASVISSGISQTVVGGDTFHAVTLRQFPERLALTSPTTSSGQIVELQPDAQSLQLPFEGSGFATQWQLSMPKASNTFDYNTMATVLFTVDFTALHSFNYEQQVIEQLDNSVSANRAFRFRNEFADAWYDLNNPNQTDTPMVVRFSTNRDDFPPNVSDLRIQHLILYFIRNDGETFEVPVRQLNFTEQDAVGAVGGRAQTIDGVISTRRGNGASWLPLIGKRPFGVWELAFNEIPEPGVGRSFQTLLDEELIEDILLVITYTGKRPKH
jgi:hypothetical protein